MNSAAVSALSSACANCFVLRQSRQRSDTDEIVVHHLLRNADDENQMHRVLRSRRNARLRWLRPISEHDLLDQIGAGMRKRDAMFRRPWNCCSSRSITAARNLSARATLPLPAADSTISRIASSRVRARSSSATCFSSRRSARTTAIRRTEDLLDYRGKASYPVNRQLWQLKTFRPASTDEATISLQKQPLRPGLRQCDVAFLPRRTRPHHGLAAAARHHDELGHHEQHRHHHDRVFQSRSAAHHFLFQSRDRLGDALDRGAALPVLRRLPRARAHARSAFSRPDGDGKSRRCCRANGKNWSAKI